MGYVGLVIVFLGEVIVSGCVCFLFVGLSGIVVDLNVILIVVCVLVSGMLIGLVVVLFVLLKLICILLLLILIV